jgi:hypothetical protein
MTVGSGGGSSEERATTSGSGGTSRVDVILEATERHGRWNVFYSHLTDTLFNSGLTPLIVAMMVGFFTVSVFVTGTLATIFSNVGLHAWERLFKLLHPLHLDVGKHLDADEPTPGPIL